MLCHVLGSYQHLSVGFSMYGFKPFLPATHWKESVVLSATGLSPVGQIWPRPFLLIPTAFVNVLKGNPLCPNTFFLKPNAISCTYLWISVSDKIHLSTRKLEVSLGEFNLAPVTNCVINEVVTELFKSSSPVLKPFWSSHLIELVSR